MEKDFSSYYNKGNDCDACVNQYICGVDGDEVGCTRYDNKEKCKFVERDE